MRITCPHCGFAKEIATEQIPTNVVRVTCPDCRQPFPLEAVEESAPVEAVVQDITDSGAFPDDETALAETVAESGAAPEETVTPETTEKGPDPEDGTIPDTEPVDTEPGSDESPSGEPVEPTGPACGEPAEPASIGARYAAMLIDAMLILIMVMILRAGVSWLGNGIPFERQIMLGTVFMLFALTLGFAYNTLFIGVCGQTPGKMLLRIQVVAADCSAMTYRRAMLREVLGKTLSLPLLLGYLMAMFNPRRLAAHDKIADTCVVKLITEATVD